MFNLKPSRRGRVAGSWRAAGLCALGSMVFAAPAFGDTLFTCAVGHIVKVRLDSLSDNVAGLVLTLKDQDSTEVSVRIGAAHEESRAALSRILSSVTGAMVAGLPMRIETAGSSSAVCGGAMSARNATVTICTGLGDGRCKG